MNFMRSLLPPCGARHGRAFTGQSEPGTALRPFARHFSRGAPEALPLRRRLRLAPLRDPAAADVRVAAVALALRLRRVQVLEDLPAGLVHGGLDAADARVLRVREAARRRLRAVRPLAYGLGGGREKEG